MISQGIFIGISPTAAAKECMGYGGSRDVSYSTQRSSGWHQQGSPQFGHKLSHQKKDRDGSDTLQTPVSSSPPFLEVPRLGEVGDD